MTDRVVSAPPSSRSRPFAAAVISPAAMARTRSSCLRPARGATVDGETSTVYPALLQSDACY
jgi:hypothetical protein